MKRSLRRFVRVRAEERCEYCRLHESDLPLLSFHVDHILPKKHGGTDDPELLAYSPIRKPKAKLFHREPFPLSPRLTYNAFRHDTRVISLRMPCRSFLMRRAFLSLGLSLALGISANAQQASQLELVRALRTAGMVDLALERLKDFKANPNLLTADEKKLLPLEEARIRLEEASLESDDSRRASLILQARGSFEEFIKANPTHPMAAQANVEIARLFALQAKGQLSKANRIENREAKALEFSRARPIFTTAYNRYQGAITNLETRLKSIADTDPLKAELTRSKAQAELDAAVLQYELALTFIGEDEARQKGEGVDKAQKAFEKIADRYQNARIGFLASVWSWQCAFVNGEASKAVPAIEKFITTNRNNRDAADAVRLASFFGIEHVYESDAKDTSAAGKYIRTEQAAQRWLQAYPEAKNTPEGIGARYRRGLMKEAQAFLPGGVIFSELPKPKPMPPMPKPKTSEKDKDKEKPAEPVKEPPPPVRKIIGISAGAKQLLEDANKIYKEIADTDNEYSDRAQRRRLINQLVVLEAEGKGGDPPLKSINTLEQAYLAAKVQQARIYDLAKSGRPETEQEKEEKKRIDNAVNYLERGLQRVTPKDPSRDVFDAQMLLVSFLTKKDRAIEAAVLGEGLARNNPKMPKAAVAAALAIFAYNSSLAKLKEANGDDVAQESDVKRIVALAAFAEKTWPNDGPTDAIRHVLSFYQANRDKDYEAAWKTHSRISSGYSDVYQARREMAAAMFYLIRPEEKDPKKYRDTLTANITKRAADFRATLAALEALQEPPATSPAYQAEAWAGAKTMQAQLYYMNGDYDKVDAVVKSTVEGLMKLDSLEAKKNDLAYTIRGLKYNSLQGRAADFIRAKEFAKVGEVLAPELDALKKEMKAPPPEETPGFTRMRIAQRSFLISAMSAFVQNKQVDQASEMLDALQASGGSLEQNVATMRSLNTTIQGQIETLTKEGKKADAAELATSFTEFLDKIKGDDVSKLPNGVILFLGQGYGAVNQNAKATELFDQLLKKPFEPNPKDPDAAAKHATFIRQMEYLQARAYRQAGVQGGGKPDFDKAAALMKKVVGDPIAPKSKPVPQGWGYRNIDIRKEYCALLEDQNFFGPAVSNWVKLTNEFVPGGLPQPVKFLGQRQTFGTLSQVADMGLATSFQLPTSVAGFIDVAFKNVFPAIAERRNQQRQLYFDFFFEAQRCSARAYTTPAVAVRVTGGPEAIALKLQDIGQRLFDLITKNDDVPTDVKENIQDFLNEDRYKVIKKKFEDLTATLPKAATP